MFCLTSNSFKALPSKAQFKCKLVVDLVYDSMQVRSSTLYKFCCYSTLSFQQRSRVSVVISLIIRFESSIFLIYIDQLKIKSSTRTIASTVLLLHHSMDNNLGKSEPLTFMLNNWIRECTQNCAHS